MAKRLAGLLLAHAVFAVSLHAFQPAPLQSARAPAPTATFHSPFPSPDLPEPVQGAGVVPTNFQSSAWPVRTMLFIDGTWLYYSFHGRRPGCPVIKRFGPDWQYSHRVAFERLPAIIAQSLHTQLLDNSQSQRFVEVVRTVVFTSARADTHPDSHRMRMFREMEDSNFEVHMSVTHGVQEKCVDISLAVEMMHYASIPGGLDCAVLLTGDKDFMPALKRIRQKVPRHCQHSTLSCSWRRARWRHSGARLSRCARRPSRPCPPRCARSCRLSIVERTLERSVLAPFSCTTRLRTRWHRHIPTEKTEPLMLSSRQPS